MSNADTPTPPDPGPNPDGVTPAPYAPTAPYAAPVPAADAAPPVAGLPTASWSSASASALYPGTEVPGAGSGYPQGPGAYPPPAGGAYTATVPLPTGPGGTYPGPAPARRRDGVSIGALVTGLLGMSLIAVVLGVVGLRRTRANGTDGRGMAIAGIVLGGLSFVAWAIFGILFAVGFSAQDRQISGLREECAAGELASCDSLAITAEWGSEDRAFGKTCGGLTDGTGTFLCSNYEPGRWVQGDDATLDALWVACESDDNEACDDLSSDAPTGSEYWDFAQSCGGQTYGGGMCALRSQLWDTFSGSDGSPGADAEAQGDDSELGALRDACASGDGTACRDLAFKAPLMSDDEEFGMTCGGTRESSYLSCP